MKPGTQVTAGRNEAKGGESMEELSHRPRNKSQGTKHGHHESTILWITSKDSISMEELPWEVLDHSASDS